MTDTTTTTSSDLATLVAEVAALRARADITEMMNRYGRALDDHDWVTFEDLFAEDVVCEHGVVAPPIHGRDAFLGFLQTVQPKMRYCQHYVTNAEVTLHNDDTADLRAFILAMHDVDRGDGTNDVIPAGGQYHVHLRRVASAWKIDRLTVHETWVDHRVPAIYMP
jgi:hypothetical protein